ncbi:MAG: NERD domain-containing protein [Verrucomicrobia bacterium]|jgi:hypothetical protein|nr:NERD domain-containing protein [Verrucomicrobiota bacterium]MBT7067474.1 NERD domain-containing protein [Verrucomicrobiota bacterium]
MICKERDRSEHPESDRFSKAGAEAEEKMAFYLRRAFAETKEIRVFNDLRFRDDTGDRAQIDHLVLHRHGFVVVESKSVSTKVKVNEHGEWSRQWNRNWQGMQSPVQQAKFQVDFLRRALNASCEELVGKALGVIQTRFTNCPMDVLVAISDKGTIERGMKMPEAVKADQVPDRIRDTVKRHKKASSFFNLDVRSNDGIYKFSDDEMSNISAFLTGHHYALTEQRAEKRAQVKETRAEYTTPPPAPAPIETTMGKCAKCGTQCMIKWGRYSYYWKCAACDSNMPIKEYCPTCREKMKLRKDKQKFFIRCEPCETERLYCEFEMG